MISMVVSAVAGAVANRLRGGWLKNLGVTTSTNVGRFAGAALVAGMIFWLTSIWTAAAVLTGLIFLGWQWDWTKWITGITGRLTQTQWNNKFGYPKQVGAPYFERVLALVMDDKKNYKPYVWVGMVLRGLVWWVPVFVASWYMGWTSTVESIGATAFLAVMFPVVYKIADKIRWWDRYLVTAELTYGALFGAVLRFVL